MGNRKPPKDCFCQHCHAPKAETLRCRKCGCRKVLRWTQIEIDEATRRAKEIAAEIGWCKEAAELLHNQVDLDPDAKKVLYENRWELYE